MPPTQRAATPGTPRTRRSADPPADVVDLTSSRWKAEGVLGKDVAAFEVLERILRIGRAFEREADALCLEHGISFWAFSVLAALRNVGAPHQLTPTELYRTGMITSGGMTKRLNQLESEGLVDRAPAEEDRRSVYVRLTRKGRRLVEAILPRYVALEADLVGVIPGTERRRLASTLRALLDAVEPAD